MNIATQHASDQKRLSEITHRIGEALGKAQETKSMKYIITRSPGGSVVKNEAGDALASFGNDLPSQALQGHLIHRLGEVGATVYDESRGQYLVGTMDQLING